MAQPSSTIARPRCSIPMSPEAFDAVRAEVASLRAAHGDADLDGRRLPVLLAALEVGSIVADPGVAAVGRHVVIASAAGPGEAFRLVLPGDGEPDLGWIAIDAPLGAALAGRRAGERVHVEAPGGDWVAVVVEVR